MLAGVFAAAAFALVLVLQGGIGGLSAQDGDGGSGGATPPTPGPSPTPAVVIKSKDVGSKGGVSSDGSATERAACGVTPMGGISDVLKRTGSWSDTCRSVDRAGSYARFFSFTVASEAHVTVELESTDDPGVDTFLYLLNGSYTTGDVVESDDYDGDGFDWRIERTLSAGTYTVEATTTFSGQSGSSAITVEVLEDCVWSLGSVIGPVTHSGVWESRGRRREPASRIGCRVGIRRL